MGNAFFNDNFRAFFGNLNIDFEYVEEMAYELGDKLNIIANDLSIGKFVCQLDAPASQFSPNGDKTSATIYKYELGFEDTPFYKSISTGEHGKANFIVYPRKNVHWNESQLKDINILIKIIFITLSRSRMIELLTNLCKIDLRTGISNNNGFILFLENLKSKGLLSKYTALYIDIKNFKDVNKQVGSEGGDLVIKKYANILSSHTQHLQEIVAHLDGDNFSVLVKNENVDEFLKAVSKIEISIEQNNRTYLFELEAKVGIYSINELDNTENVIEGISSAISMCKNSHTNDIVTINAEILNKVTEEKNISRNFPIALKNNEFKVFYQPKVCLDNYNLCGCEALVRWVKDGKIISPMNFIPIFERDGNICKLDFFVFETVCQNICQWISMGIEPVRVSINFSRLHIYNKNWAKDILNIIDKYNIDTKYIEIELTETLSYQDYDAFIQFIKCMKERGVNTSIDDFGTGYSSLNLLKNINVDIIKLDKSFIDSIIDTHNQTDEIVIKNVVKMVNELHMEVIAEGVETSQQVEFLKNIHCGMAQGYLFDKPLALKDFEKRLSNQRIYNIND